MRDLKYGQGDLLSFWTFFEVVGKCLGAGFVAYYCDKAPKLVFLIQGIFHCVSAVYAIFFLTDELDEDMQERGKDPELLKYEAR